MKTTHLFIIPVLMVLSAACSSNKGENADFAASADSVATALAPQPGDSVKLVKTASLDLNVKNVYESSRIISEKARLAGGMVMHHDIRSSEERQKRIPLSEDSLLVVSAYRTEAELTVKVPSSQLEQFMQDVSSAATFVNQSTLDIDDKTIDYLASSLKQKSRTELLNMAKQKSKKTSDVTDIINSEDERIRQFADNQRVDENVRFSTVQLVLSQPGVIRKEVIANNELPSYKTPFFYSLGRAFSSGWQVFLTVIVGIANLWAFIIAGILSWYAIRYYRLKRRSALHH